MIMYALKKYMRFRVEMVDNGSGSSHYGILHRRHFWDTGHVPALQQRQAVELMLWNDDNILVVTMSIFRQSSHARILVRKSKIIQLNVNSSAIIRRL